MMDLGEKSVKSFARVLLAGAFIFSLTACYHRPPCEKYLVTPPALPSDQLVKVKKPIPAVMQRNYDLCLLKKLKVQVIRVGQTWTFVLPSDDVFDNDTPEILNSYQPVLEIIANFMRTYSKITVSVRAYSDKPIDEMKTKFGTVEDELTTRQAESIVADLTARHINARLIFGEGMGAKDPISWDGTADGRRLNRRVEIHFRYYRDSTAWY
ncbi:MAG: OmpA family protein [Coxiellaceae bacterium]|nr:OmpA family protein [Coxiellaceae bacterium]